MATVTKDQPITVEELDRAEEGGNPIQPQLEFSCTRCGYKYLKTFDREPFLCNRCMRYIAKKVWVAIHTIQPANSSPPIPSVS